MVPLRVVEQDEGSEDFDLSRGQIKEFANSLLHEYQQDLEMREIHKASLLQRKMRELATQKKHAEEPGNIGNTEGMKEVEFLNWVKKEMDDEAACLSLPCSIGLVVMFAISVLCHFGISYQYDITNSATNWVVENANFAIDTTNTWGIKGFHDVHNIADWYSFMRLGYVPLMLHKGTSWSEEFGTTGTVTTTPAIKPSDLMNHNHIISDIRITLRKNKSSGKCSSTMPEDFRSGFGTDPSIICYDSPGSFEIQNHYADLGLSLLADVWSTDNVNGEGNKDVYYLEIAKDITTLNNELRAKEEQNWISEDTYKIEVSTLNVNRAFGLVSLVTMHFVMLPGGFLRKDMTVSSHWMSDFGPWYGDMAPLLTVLDVLWLLTNVSILISELWDIRSQLIHHGSVKEFASNYLGIWNTIDWLIMISCILVIYRFVQLSNGISDLALLGKSGAFEMFESGSTNAAAREVYRPLLYSQIEKNLALQEDVKLQVLGYLAISLGRMFKGFSAQPRLGLVTNTMYRAGSDIIHFMIVFLSVFFAFAIMGLLLFGNYVKEWHNFGNAIMSCWRLVVGDFDYDELAGTAWVGVALYFTTFTVLVVLIMLNMLLAIIVETYVEVKREKTEKAETLYSQAMESLGRYIRKKRRLRVGLEEIYDRFLGVAKRRIMIRRELEHRHAMVVGGKLEAATTEEARREQRLEAILAGGEASRYSFFWRLLVRGPAGLFIGDSERYQFEDEQLFIPTHMVLDFITSEQRYVTPAKLKLIMPNIPLAQAERLVKTALIDMDATVEMVIPPETATEALYTMLGDDLSEMVDKIGSLEKKITQLTTTIGGDAGGGASLENSASRGGPGPGGGDFNPRSRTGKPLPILAAGEALPDEQQPPTQMTRGSQAVMRVDRGTSARMSSTGMGVGTSSTGVGLFGQRQQEMQELKDQVAEQNQMLRDQALQIADLKQLLITHVLPPGAHVGGGPGPGGNSACSGSSANAGSRAEQRTAAGEQRRRNKSAENSPSKCGSLVFCNRPERPDEADELIIATAHITTGDDA
ncbi:unnamed protein product [Amoebophrya sp. A25]|nr:unnamed protein product [Amoebophrya sp. A25]|eukprot:GSA25T00009717001.1